MKKIVGLTLAAAVVLVALWVSGYAATGGKYQYKVVYPASFCATTQNQFEPGRCEDMLNGLGAQGWRLVGSGGPNSSALYFIKE